MGRLVLMFPHQCITEWEEGQLLEIQPHYEFPRNRLERLFGEYARIIARLRRRGMAITALLHRGESGDYSPLSVRFALNDNDQMMDSGIIADEKGRWLDKQRYPEWKNLLNQIPDGKLLVGGFHYDDCVQKFVRAVQVEGRTVRLSPRFTDRWYLYCRSRIIGEEYPFPLPVITEPSQYWKECQTIQRALRHKLFGF